MICQRRLKMLTMKKMIAEAIVERLGTALSVEDVERMLEYPPDANMGDLALPCFKLSKILRNAPVKIAASLADGF
jgi:arginyl-tRNA synthetase